MCAALLKMKKRATISFTRSKDWCQLHTLVHAPILRKYGCTGLLHVSTKFRGPRACAALCDWHQCFDLVELIVALLCIPDIAAHACSLRNLTDTCNSTV